MVDLVISHDILNFLSARAPVDPGVCTAGKSTEHRAFRHDIAARSLRSKTASQKWRTVVANRKGAMGRGWVNGSPFDFTDIL